MFAKIFQQTQKKSFVAENIKSGYKKSCVCMEKMFPLIKIDDEQQKEEIATYNRLNLH